MDDERFAELDEKFNQEVESDFETPTEQVLESHGTSLDEYREYTAEVSRRGHEAFDRLVNPEQEG